MSTHNPEPTIGVLMHDVARMLRLNFNRRARALGLTQTQWQAIAVLKRHEGASQATVAELLEVQPITLARLIDRLESAGWVERRPNPDDRRAVQLFLTAKSQPALAQMSEMAALTRVEAMAGFTEAEQVQLVQLLSRMRENLMATEPATEDAGVEKSDVDAVENH